MDGTWIRQTGEKVDVDIVVVPRASRSEIRGIYDGRLKIQLTASPVDGKANKALIQVMAKWLGVGRSQLEIIRGLAGRRKCLRVSGLNSDEALKRLESVHGGLC
jgi:hypothetical protein